MIEAPTQPVEKSATRTGKFRVLASLFLLVGLFATFMAGREIGKDSVHPPSALQHFLTDSGPDESGWDNSSTFSRAVQGLVLNSIRWNDSEHTFGMTFDQFVRLRVARLCAPWLKRYSRDLSEANLFSYYVNNAGSSPDGTHLWIVRLGPVCPALDREFPGRLGFLAGVWSDNAEIIPLNDRGWSFVQGPDGRDHIARKQPPHKSWWSDFLAGQKP